MDRISRVLLVALTSACLTSALQDQATAQYPVVVAPAVAPVGYAAERRGLFGRRVVVRSVYAPVAPVAVPATAPVAVARPVIAAPTVTVARTVIASPTVSVGYAPVAPVAVAPVRAYYPRVAPVRSYYRPVVPVTTYRVPITTYVPPTIHF